MTDDELRALAEAATPGPWVRSEDSVSQDGGASAWCGIADCRNLRRYGVRDNTPPYSQKEANAAFIAAASPDVVLGLLDRLDAANAALLQSQAREVGLEHRIGALEEAYDQLSADRSRDLDELTAECERLRDVAIGERDQHREHSRAMHVRHEAECNTLMDIAATVTQERDEARAAVRLLAGALERIAAVNLSGSQSLVIAATALTDPAVKKIVEGS